MYKILKKATAVMLSAAMAFTMLPAMNLRAADEKETFKAEMKTHADIFNGKADQYKGKTVILHSNDVHGQIDGYACIAELEDDFEEAGAEVITMDAGDYSQGDPYVSYSKGADAVTLMNVAGYEYSTLGNHEFDYGYEQLKSNMKNAKFQVLCADVLENNKTIYDAETVYTTKSGVKIGIFGMETPETQTKANPKLIEGLTFLNNTNGKTGIFDCAKKEVKALKEQGADIIISLSHLGMEEESKGDKHRSCDMYENVEGIDMILDGHSHTVMTEGLNKEPIQSTGTKFDNIGVVVIDDAAKKISEHYLVDTEGLDKDPEVEAAAKEISKKVDDVLGQIFAKSETTFASEKTENRCYETNTGDLITDAMMWEILKDKKSLKVSADNVVALTNGGGIRAGLKVGDITKKDINTILPFGNTLSVVYLTGEQLLEVLEASTFNTPEAIGGYPQTKGIKFTINIAKAYDQGDAYPNSTYYAPKTLKRVNIESINGKAFKKSATYAVVTNNYSADGGDTYYVMAHSSGRIDTGFPLDEVVCRYITEKLGGVLTEARYGAPRGDVKTIFALDGSSFTKVTPAKTKLTLKWNATTDNAEGYQIAYSTSKSFTKATTKIVNKEIAKNSATIKNLKAKKTYYVKIRTCAKLGNVLVYSGWSTAKKVKTK
ncbi:MAG: bifunctional metallophosphatase/5'-nucleotidase [Lachnospiraceae bacterium]|nr:bifunctional metallophosphatase/5'-nucleotidase [Lachnospiraceae bacterium]